MKLKRTTYIVYHLQTLLTALFLMVLVVCCTPEHQSLSTDNNTSKKALFMFGEGSLDELPVEVSALRGATINTGALDKVNQIRVIVPEKNLNVVFSTQGNTNPTYLYEDLKAGETCTFYFIANDNGDRSYSDAYTPEEAEALTQYTLPYFTKDNPPENNVMTSKYEVKRVGDSYQYRRVYPKPDNDFRADLTENNGVYGIPIWLYPTYSRFNISIQWPTVDDPDFTKENNGQEIHFDFIDFPTEMKIFGGTKDFSGTDVRTVSIDLAADFKKENLSYSLFFPATSTATEKVHLRYSFDGTEHTILVKPKETTKFDLNTQYKLPLVIINPLYDVWIEKLYTIEKISEKEIFRNVADYTVKESQKQAYIHMGVPYNYCTIAVVKSRMAPADFKISDAAGVYWITCEKELVEKREIFFEDDIPYYRQYYVLSYDVDNTAQKKPLISSFVAYNTKDKTKIANLEASFNVLSRYAMMNLGNLNTFANGKTTEEGMNKTADPKLEGKLYQFARNVPLAPIEDNVDYIGPLPLYDSQIWTINKFIYGESIRTEAPKTIFSWWKSDDATPYDDIVPEKYKDWQTLIKTQKTITEQKGLTMPDSYYGNNDGDPCPPGYRIPSMYDLNTIYYNSYTDLFSENENFYKKIINVADVDAGASLEVDESLLNPSADPSITPKTYKAVYKRVNDEEVYAIRFIGTPFVSAFRYRGLDPVDGFSASEISCMPLKNPTLSIDDISHETFWRQLTNAPYIEKRYFPQNHAYVNVGLYSNTPDLWSSTALPYYGGLDIDLSFTNGGRASGAHLFACPIRCIRD